MTDQSASVETMYDPGRPWISGPDEDPNRANWGAEFFNPAGETAKPVFLRGQMLLAIVRLVVVAAAVGITISQPAVGAGVALIGIGGLLILSLIQHMRRLNHAGRSVLWSWLIVLPFLLASVFTILQISLISVISNPETYTALQNAALKNDNIQAASTEADEDEAPSVEADDESAVSTRRQGGPPMPTQMLLFGAVVQGIGTWLLLSFFGFLFTTLYVARRPRAERVEDRRTSLYG